MMKSNNIASNFNVLDFGATDETVHALGVVHEFGTSGKVRVLDIFGGRRPVLKNMDGLRIQSMSKPPLNHSFLIDSNLASGLSRLSTNFQSKRNLSDQSVVEWLDYALHSKWDYNPAFYFLETMANADLIIGHENIIKTAESILRLHCMDDDLFCSSRLLEENVFQREIYFEQNNVKSYRQLAETKFNNFLNIWNSGLNDIFKIMEKRIYVSLIEMLLINNNNMNEKHVLDKVGKFRNFITNEMPLWMAREDIVAAHYFSGKSEINGLIKVNVEKDSFEVASKYLKNCAWDLLFLRLPESLIWTSIENDQLDYCVLATIDRAAVEIGRLFTVESLLGDLSEPLPYSLVLGDYDFIYRKFGQAANNAMTKGLPDATWMANSQSRGLKLSSHNAMDQLINDREQRLRYLLFKNKP